MKKRIDTLDRDLERLLVFSTGALAANAIRARRQASFTTDLHRAIIAVVIALLLFSAALFWNAIRSAATSKKDQGPEATDVPIGLFHSADRLRPQIPTKNVSDHQLTEPTQSYHASLRITPARRSGPLALG